MDVAAAAGQGQARDLALAGLVEEAEMDPVAMAREDGKLDAFSDRCRSHPRRQAAGRDLPVAGSQDAQPLAA